MTLTRKDAAATALTILVVLAFLATHEGWGVPLISDSLCVGRKRPSDRDETVFLFVKMRDA